MLKIENVNVKRILKDVSVFVPKGKITVLLGRNGCGKTTLLRTVIGAKTYQGTIYLDNKNLAEYSPSQRAKKVGMLAQVLPETSLTVKQLAELGRNPYVGGMGVMSENDRVMTQAALVAADVTILADRCVSTLSGGQKQRAYLAMLLAQNPELVLMDEPATYLDPASANELYGLMIRLTKEQNKTVLAVMHDPSCAVAVADRIVIMQDGMVVYADTKERCLADCAIERCFSLKRYTAEDQVFFK